jgi:glycosyltransferase involved in cell wall biosynthesis
MKLSVIVPCYNEVKNIPLILEKFASVIKRPDIEILFVNNGSKDTSQEVFDQLIPKYFLQKSLKLK